MVDDLRDDARASHNRAQKSWFDREAGAYESQLTRTGRRNHDRKMSFLDRTFGLGAGSRLLELGAGSGLHLSWLAENRPEISYLGVDLSVGMLRLARERKPPGSVWGLAVGDALTLPCRSGAFDAAFAVDVVHHVPDPVRMFSEMARTVRPGGAIAVLEPNWLFPVNLVYLARPVEWGVFRSRVGNLTAWAAAAGWTGIRPLRLPIFFPPFPGRLFPLYERFERSVGGLDPALYFSTTLGVAGFPPSPPESTGGVPRSSPGR
jgi:SAM-dependent methyltransferase